MSAVQSSAWRAPDGRVGNFLVNISRETQSFGIVLDGEEERIRLAPWEVRALLRHAD
jgi:hypothetical protein